jgi:hypothetical protein
MCNWFVDAFHSHRPVPPKLFELLPKLLLVLARAEKDVSVDGTDPRAYRNYFVQRLYSVHWPADSLLPVLGALRYVLSAVKLFALSYVPL